MILDFNRRKELNERYMNWMKNDPIIQLINRLIEYDATVYGEKKLIANPIEFINKQFPYPEGNKEDKIAIDKVGYLLLCSKKYYEHYGYTWEIDPITTTLDIEFCKEFGIDIHQGYRCLGRMVTITWDKFHPFVD